MQRGRVAAEKASAYETLDLPDVLIIRATCTSSTDFKEIVSKEIDDPEAKTAATQTKSSEAEEKTRDHPKEDTPTSSTQAR